jgi:hypothetical protein
VRPKKVIYWPNFVIGRRRRRNIKNNGYVKLNEKLYEKVVM